MGSPNLKIANIRSYDFRWEWYFGFGDSMSFGLFYKEFEISKRLGFLGDR